MSHKWFYNQDGAQYGPVDQAVIIELIQDGELSPGSPVCPDGLSNWQSARDHSCFQVMISPRKPARKHIAQKPNLPPPKRPATRSENKTPRVQAAPTRSPQLAPSSPLPAPVPNGERKAWLLLASGLAALVIVVAGVVALTLSGAKPNTTKQANKTVTVNLSSGEPLPTSSPLVPPANSLQLAQTYLQEGTRYYFGRGGFSQDYPKAYQSFRKAADLGNANAQYNLGIMSGDGVGILKNETAAVAWYRKAASQGHSGAQLNLGIHLSDGRGVPENDVEAVAWYRKAAVQGVDSAQNNLGVQYANGYGVQRSLVTAYAWYNIAAAKGNETAIKNKEQISQAMSSDEITQAQALSNTLSAQIQNP
jgi:TPR repeat protein